MDFTNSLSNNYAKKLVKLAKKSGVPTKSYYWCEKQLKQIEKDCGTFAKKDVMLQVTRDDPKAVTDSRTNSTYSYETSHALTDQYGPGESKNVVKIDLSQLFLLTTWP